MLVIDEAFHKPGLVENVPLALVTLEGDLIDVPHRHDRELLAAARSALLSALSRAEVEALLNKSKRAPLTRAMVKATGLDADTCREARRIEWSRRIQ